MSKGTPKRSIRVGALWEEAQRLADQRGDNLSEIVRQALEKYVQDNHGGTMTMNRGKQESYMDMITNALDAIEARCMADRNVHGSDVHLDREYLLAITRKLLAEGN